MSGVVEAFVLGVAGGAGSYIGVRHVGPLLDETAQKVADVATDNILVTVNTVSFGSIFIACAVTVVNPIAGFFLIGGCVLVPVKTIEWLQGRERARRIAQ